MPCYYVKTVEPSCLLYCLNLKFSEINVTVTLKNTIVTILTTYFDTAGNCCFPKDINRVNSIVETVSVLLWGKK